MSVIKIKIKGDWQKELEHYKPNFGREYLEEVLADETLVEKREKINPYNLTYNRSKAPRNSRGFVDPETMPVLESIRNITGLQDCQIVLQKYETGQVQLIHRDYMPGYDLAERADVNALPKDEYQNLQYKRMLLLLEDRKPGQFMQAGDTMINHWEAGDCFYYDTINTYHSAGNCGPYPRIILRITGLDTPEFQNFLSTPEHVL